MDNTEASDIFAKYNAAMNEKNKKLFIKEREASWQIPLLHDEPMFNDDILPIYYLMLMKK